MKKYKVTSRSKRMQHFLQVNSRSSLSLVSLMDIFTILVFFLLVSSGAQNLPTSKNIKLPTSVSQKAPEETLVLAITKDSILVQGKKIASLDQALTATGPLIEPLIIELKFHSSRVLMTQTTKSQGLAITIMGDENIPYQLLKKILTSCQNANYTQIAFAAYQTSKSKK